MTEPKPATQLRRTDGFDEWWRDTQHHTLSSAATVSPQDGTPDRIRDDAQTVWHLNHNPNW
jgi:hypothetical protein